ncbi:hypothetical protein Anas_06892 [Armadillidium nasatum]|uniref:Uncharacterized protein n=1 Tax=Armadillidium nasatum TaxID=96803 RepID=A0A5N5SWN8_9CRUS|nr:hypothetical protein Anas_06892 [Armadillidium nasatum]
MCLLCCCPSAKTCTLISANYSWGDHLKTEFMESMWSWFMLDEEACKENDENYFHPEWYQELPTGYEDVESYDLVKRDSNYVYQIMFFILNSLWAIFSAILLCGRITHIHILYIPWLIVGILTTFLDTLVGSFYIAFMAQTNGGFQEGKAIFAMQFLFFRGFIFYIFNLFAIIFVASNFYSEWRKHRREKKITKKAKKHAERHATAVATAAVAASTAAVVASTSKSQPPKKSSHDKHPPQNLQKPQNSHHDYQQPQSSRHDYQPPQNSRYENQPPQKANYDYQQAQKPHYGYQPPQTSHYENQPPQNPRYDYRPPPNPRPDYEQNVYQQKESFTEVRQPKPSVSEKYQPPKPSVPEKYQPFSYTNPAFRPSDPYDIEAMKRNASPVNSLDYGK